MRQRRTFEPQFDISQVRRLVEAWVQSQEKPFWDVQVLTSVATSLEVSRHLDTPRLKGQVRRVLDQMAERGELYKDSQGGFGQGKAITYFYPPAAWREKQDKDEAETRRVREAKERSAARWESVNDRLCALGIISMRFAKEAPSLSSAQWNELLDLAEAKGTRS